MLSSLFALIARRKCLVVVSVLFLVGWEEIRAQSGPFSFIRVAEEYPGVGYPALDAGRVAFVTSGEDGFDAIYEGPIAGPFRRVVDESTLIPGAVIPFGSLVYQFGFDAGRVAFYGGQGAYRGIYLFEGGVIKPVAIPTTSMPSSTRNFGQFSWPPTVDDGRVVFTGQSDTTVGVQPLRGVYMANDPALSRIADTTMPSPGDAGNFTSSFQDPVIEGAKIAFVGNWPERSAIFVHDLNTGVHSRVVDHDTPIPGSAATFGFFDHFDLDCESLAFTNRGGANAGVYAADITTGSLITVAETGMEIPGSEPMQFVAPFTSVSMDEGHVAFSYSESDGVIATGLRAASPDEFHGVYSNLPGSLTKVIATGDLLDGKLVRRASIGRQGLQGNQILTDILFEDNTGGLYLATLIPEPSTVGLLICGCLALLATAPWRRRLRVPSIALFAATVLISGAAQCAAEEILWGFEGVVTRTENLPPGADVGSRFGGIIRFTSVPDATTVYDTTAESQHHLWSGVGTGIEISLDGVDFSTIGRANNRLTMHYRDEGIDIPLHLREDSVFIGASAESYWYSSPPGGPGSTGASYGGFRRNIHIELHDFDGEILAGASPLEVPFDIREMEEATFGASSYPADGPGRSFTGTIDRLYAIPEPATVLLLGIGVSLLAIGCTVRHATPCAE